MCDKVFMCSTCGQGFTEDCRPIGNKVCNSKCLRDHEGPFLPIFQQTAQLRDFDALVGRVDTICNGMMMFASEIPQTSEQEDLSIPPPYCWDSCNRTLNFKGDGPSFFSLKEMIDLNNDLLTKEEGPRRVAKLCANAYPLLREKLLPHLPEGFELIYCDNSKFPDFEEGKEILFDDYFERNRLERSFLIGPHFLFDYIADDSFKEYGNRIGKLKAYETYSNVLFLDAKLGDSFTREQIDDFFYDLRNVSDIFSCQMRGFLFNEREFILFGLNSGSAKEFTRGFFSSPGTLKLIQDFLQPRDTKLYNCVMDACHRYQAYPTVYGPRTGSALLGVGAVSKVIELTSASDPSVRYALKISCMMNDMMNDIAGIRDEDCKQAAKLSANPRTHQSVWKMMEDTCFVLPPPLAYVSHLMPYAISIPSPRPFLPKIEANQLRIVALGNIHAAQEIHGNPHRGNCIVAHDHKWKWIDFVTGDTFHEKSIINDLQIFLRSVRVDLSSNGKLERYAALMVSGEWRAASFVAISERNQFLIDLLISSTSKRSSF